MIIYILKKLFRIAIGDLPEDKKREFWIKFTILLEDVARAGAEGTMQGAMRK